MVVTFKTTYAISAYHHSSCKLESCSWPGVLDTTLCDKVLLVTCGRLVIFTRYSGFSTNKTDRHDIAEILLKLTLKPHNPNPNTVQYMFKCPCR